MKLIRSTWIVLALMLVLGIAAGSEEELDGPHTTFQDPLLDSLVGHWDISRTIRGKQEHNTLDVDWTLKHQFLQLHMKDAAEPPQYEALVLIGYDHGAKQYVIHWCDTFGGKFSARGTGKRSGDSIEFVFQYPDGPFYNTFSRDPATGAWTFLMEGQGEDGKRQFFARDTLSKQ